ncbi:MAG: hypothetical protein WDO19_01195 [Bacteroidota bacterium]
MRKAAVYYKDVLAGILTETDEGEYNLNMKKNMQKNTRRNSSVSVFL